MLAACVARFNNKTSATEGDLSERFTIQCAIVCGHVAQETIELAHTRRSTNSSAVGPISAHWYNTLFVYSAATVLVAARLCPLVLQELSNNAIIRSWNMAIEILELYQNLNPVIPKLIAALHLLFNVLPSHYTQSKRLDAGLHENDEVEALEDESANPAVQQYHDNNTSGGANAPVSTHTSQVQDFDALHATGDFDFSFDANDMSWLSDVPFQF